MEILKFLDNCKLDSVEINYDRITCEDKNWIFYVSESITASRDFQLLNKIYNLIYEWLTCYGITCSYQGREYLWKFYFDDSNAIIDAPPYYVNVVDLLSSYPDSFMDRVKRVLLNLSAVFSSYGEQILLGDDVDTNRLLINELNPEIEAISFVRILADLGYVNILKNNPYNIIISAEGWKLIDELKRKKQEIKQGFIAMRFGEETKSIRKTFKRSISDSGYSVRVIDEKEHNNQIVPEIFFEIERSKFMVVDITYPNYGAYYEAGYGQALGKEVIVCCSEEVFNSKDKSKRPHFDIAQKSTIVWEDLDDLYEKLKRRIEATVK